MKRIASSLVAFLALTAGCVSTGEYKKKEQEAAQLMQQKAQLEQDKASLQQRISQIEQEKTEAAQTAQSKQVEIDKLKGTYDELVSSLKDEIASGQVKVTQLKDKLTVNMVDKILFDSGSAELKEKGMQVLGDISKVLKSVQDKDIRIEGHTDNVRLGPTLRKKYPTNWELSAARATNMVRFLQEKGGVAPERLIAAGYSQYHPVAPNDNEEGRSQNRRLEIVLVPSERSLSAPQQ